jgi:stearoyl-CoA desaturase (delta-9 desaturase)
MSIALDETDKIEENRQDRRRRLAVDAPFLHKLQFRHFILFDVIPFFGTLGAMILAFYYPIGWLNVSLFAGMWLLTGLGISAGYHRLFTHRSFKTVTAVRLLLAIFGSMAGQGAVISWVAMHRRHHECADKPGDMHSPNLHGKDIAGRIRGFIHAHYTWMIKHEYPNVAHYVPDLLRERTLVRTARLYRWWIVLGLLVPAAIGGAVTQSAMGALTGFLWGGMVRMFVVGHSMWALNSILHTMGSQPFRLRENPNDNSRNNWLLGVLAWGEGWHNNHHAFPNSAWFGLAWYRVDLAYWFISILRILGLAWDVKLPTKARLAARAAEQTAVAAE